MQRVDADGQVVQPGLVQGLDDAVAQQEAVRDDARVRLAAGVGDELGDVGVHERLAAEHRDVGGMQAVEGVDAFFEVVGGDGVREVVELGAVAAAQVAAAGDDQLGVEGCVGEEDSGSGGEEVLNLHLRLA